MKDVKNNYSIVIDSVPTFLVNVRVDNNSKALLEGEQIQIGGTKVINRCVGNVIKS